MIHRPPHGVGCRPFLLWLALLYLICLVIPPAGMASAWSQKLRMEDKSGVSIDVSSMIDILPGNGFYPLRIAIKNSRDQAGRWSFNFQMAGSYDDFDSISLSHSFAVGPNDEKIFDLMVPVYPLNTSRHAYPRMTIHVLGPGTRSDSRITHASTYRGGIGAFVAISQSIATRNMGALESSVSTQRLSVSLGRIALDHLADDVRAYSGMDTMMMQVEEWEALGYQHRYVIKQWLALGGSLLLFDAQTEGRAVPADLGGGVGKWPDQWRFGWGQVLLLPVNDRQVMDADAVVKTVIKLPNLYDQSVQGYTRDNWPLRKLIPDIEQPKKILVLTAIALAFILGPVNLFMAHRRKKQIQLLWTTPLLSVVASVLIAIAIVFADGFGGYGHRTLLSCLLSDDQLEVIAQEQVSRSGVLLSRRFDMGPAQILTPVQIEKRLKSFSQLQLSIDGMAGGAWFSSRSIQGQILQKAQPSRARLELWKKSGDEDSPPEVFSAINETIEKVYIIDRDGACWSAGPLRAGESAQLTAIPKAEFNRWFRAVHDRGGARHRAHLKGWDQINGAFFAELKQPERKMFATLSSIRWKQQHAMVMGPVVEVDVP